MVDACAASVSALPSMLYFWISLIVLLGTLAAFLEVLVGLKQIRQLRDIPAGPHGNNARVSIIFAALNEADTIEPALASMLSLDYPDLEIIAIDDRSTDTTGSILDRLAGDNPRLRVLHIHDLPAGWLGKNHALHRGAQLANGDYLLFTDADVVFNASTIARAVTRCEQNGLDHLTVFPEVPVREHLLAMILLAGYFALFLRWKPWKVSTSADHYVGIGAFNMLRSRAYREMGGHEALPLAVLDDLMLGKLAKQCLYRQEALFGAGMVSVAWYPDTRAMFKGMQKNSFALADYKLGNLIIATALLLPQLWPWVGLFVTSGLAWWLNFAAVTATVLFFLYLLRPLAWSPLCLLYLPVVNLVSLGMLWTASLLTLMRGGIDWRGTRYSLDELRRAHEKPLRPARTPAAARRDQVG